MERLELPELNERYFMEEEAAEQKQDAHAVNHTVQQTGTGGRRKILGWHRYFFDVETQMSGLDDHFLVEDEAIRIERKRDLFESLPAIGSVARVIFSQAQAQRPVFQHCEESIANIFP